MYNLKIPSRSNSGSPTDKYEFSRKLFIVEIMSASVVGSLTSGVFLSGFFEYIGMSQSLNGIISSISVLSSVFQPLGAIMAGHTGSIKNHVIRFALCQRILFAILFLVPQITQRQLWVPVVFLIFLAGNILTALLSPCSTDWLMQITPKETRRQYFSAREIALIALSAAVNLLIGLSFDYCKASGTIQTAFIYLSIAVAVFNLVNLLCLFNIKAPPQVYSGEAKLTGLLAPLRDERFQRVVFLICLYHFAIYFSGPFWNIYQLDNLALSYRYLTLLGVVCSIAKVVLLRYYMKISVVQSWSLMCIFSLLARAAASVLFAFVVPSNAVWFILIPSAFDVVGTTFIGMSVLNFEYSNIGAGQNGAVCIGIIAVATGVTGFVSSLLAGWMLDVTERFAPKIGVVPIAGQQIQMIVTAFFLLLTCRFMWQMRKNNKIT